MFSKIFHTASYRRKLPVPFFEVLDQEHAALRGGETTAFSWNFALDQLKDPTAGLLERIKPFLPPDDQAALPETASKLELVRLLNRLLQSPVCLLQDPDFPKAGLSRELIAMAGLDLDAAELVRVNRLLLEAAFPEHLRRIQDLHLAAIYRRIHRGQGCAGLCFSGGGIRSATFALGVTQGLARHGLLRHFDYLSTVSGGGYIGSWLSSWIYRARGPDKVFAALAAARAETPTEPEPKPLMHLRAFSNYLSPKLGAFSADAWVLVATYARNLLLNWLVFVPIMLALIALPRLHVSLLHLTPPDWGILAGFAAGFALAVAAIAYCIINRPMEREHLRKHGGAWFARRDQESFLKWCLAPLCLAAIAVTTSWGWAQQRAGGEAGVGLAARMLEYLCGRPGLEAPAPGHYLALGAALHLAGWLIAMLEAKRWRGGWLPLLRESPLVAATGAVGGLFLWAAATLGSERINESPGLALYTCFSVPLFLLLFLIAATLFIGVSSNMTSDQDREWWARMGAWLLIVVVGWSLFSALVLFGPLALLALPKLLGAVGGLSGLFTLVAGYSAGSADGKDGQGRNQLAAQAINKALSLAAPVSLAALVAGLSLATSGLLRVAVDRLPAARTGFAGALPAQPSVRFNRVVHESPWWLTGGFLAACAVFGCGLSRFINVNRFSLHAIYRNRLVRAYLGASNSSRQPNPFTGFDSADNVPLRDLRDPGNPALPQRPLHLVNMALNLVTGENLAWQQRKAETFTASTLFCGNYRLGYRYTKHYALGHEKRGLSLGTSVAISGAAASPNQGYHSSPMVALLMTLFNVRLGWWLGNPGAMGHNTFRDTAPRSPVRHFVKEGLGLTDSTSAYVYLSDGGHFENLGLYEMVLRRCRVIVVSDAGCDPRCALDDLGNAIRKIRVDLGVRIEMQQFDIRPRGDDADRQAGKHCAVGVIDYGTADEGAAKGVLIYLKPALCGDEPRDVYNYARASKEFPHESTGDQWFSESQFESYRALGQHVIDQIYAGRTDSQAEDELADFIAQARRHTGVHVPGGEAAKTEVVAAALAASRAIAHTHAVVPGAAAADETPGLRPGAFVAPPPD